jgi:hypothetical protein
MIPLKYGKCPENPINLNSITASRVFLVNLLTSSGFHILYHRMGSLLSGKFPVDHYEIMSSGNEYDDLYINIYNETNAWIPPDGYLFDSRLEICLFYLSEYELSEINETEIEVNDRYLFQKEWHDDPEALVERANMVPPLEIFLEESFGRTGRVNNFPYPLIDELLHDHELCSAENLDRVLQSVCHRDITNTNIENKLIHHDGGS